MELAEKVTGAPPVPDRLTVWGLVTALSVNVNVPEAEPTAVGEKVTPTVQLAPAATPAPQVLLATANGPLTPLTPTLLTVSVVFRRFVSVIMRVEFVASTTLPKLKLAGENVTGALAPPERGPV